MMEVEAIYQSNNGIWRQYALKCNCCGALRTVIVKFGDLIGRWSCIMCHGDPMRVVSIKEENAGVVI